MPSNPKPKNKTQKKVKFDLKDKLNPNEENNKTMKNYTNDD